MKQGKKQPDSGTITVVGPQESVNDSMWGERGSIEGVIGLLGQL